MKMRTIFYHSVIDSEHLLLKVKKKTDKFC